MAAALRRSAMTNVVRSVLVIGVIGLAIGCGGASGDAPQTPPAVTVDEGDGTTTSRLTLSERAAERLGIATAAVARERVGGVDRPVIPYAALLYDADGATWTYVNPEGRLFMRVPVTVDQIVSGLAVLADGPPAGTLVVTVGGAELYGADQGVGGGH
jgi:hypothetical protein